MSTVRAFTNNKRVSTGKTMKDGSFLQFYPTKTRFEDERSWRNDWMNKSHVTFEEEDEYADMPPLISVKTNLPVTQTSAPPPPRPQRNEVVTTTVTTKTKTTTVKKTPRCCICFGPMGQDHRMCLVSMMRQGIPDFMNEWHIRSGLCKEKEEADTPSPPSSPKKEKVTPSSPPPAPKKAEKEPDIEDWKFKEKHKFVAEPGTYYIGDICYFLKEPIYDRIFGSDGYESGLYIRKSDSAFFMVDSTAYGDGCYPGSDGHEYGVDAGIIGIVSRCLGPEKDEDVYGGKLHTFKDPVEIKFKNGVFRFKSNSKYLIIDTVGNEYNSDEDW